MKLTKKFLSIDFTEELNQTKDLDIRYKLLTLQALQKTQSYRESGKQYQISKDTVRDWHYKYEESGILGLKRQKTGSSERRTRPKKDLVDQADLELYIESKNGTGGSLTGSDIQDYLLKNQDVSLSLSSVYTLLDEMGYSYQTVRSIHPRTQPKKQELFKKTSKKRSKKSRRKK